MMKICLFSLISESETQKKQSFSEHRTHHMQVQIDLADSNIFSVEVVTGFAIFSMREILKSEVKRNKIEEAIFFFADEC